MEKTIDYVKNLRVPIPIMLSLVEIANYNIFGNTFLVTHIAYRVALVLCFILSIYLCSSSVSKMIISSIVSLVFLWAIVIVHPGNAQTYDIFLPLFSLLYISLLKSASLEAETLPSQMRLTLTFFASGFFLAMAELMRPFLLFVLPILITLTYIYFKNLPIKYFILFLIPVILFSGVWHSL